MSCLRDDRRRLGSRDLHEWRCGIHGRLFDDARNAQREVDRRVGADGSDRLVRVGWREPFTACDEIVLAGKQRDRAVFAPATGLERNRRGRSSVRDRHGRVLEQRARLVGDDAGEIGANRLPERGPTEQDSTTRDDREFHRRLPSVDTPGRASMALI